MQYDDLQMLHTFMTKNEWLPNLPKQDQSYFKHLAEKAFQDKNKVVWIRLEDFNYSRTSLYLPSWYQNESMCEAHDSILGGHNMTHKTSKSQLHTTGQKCFKTSIDTKTSAYIASNEKNPQTKCLPW